MKKSTKLVEKLLYSPSGYTALSVKQKNITTLEQPCMYQIWHYFGTKSILGIDTTVTIVYYSMNVNYKYTFMIVMTYVNYK